MAHTHTHTSISGSSHLHTHARASISGSSHTHTPPTSSAVHLHTFHPHLWQLTHTPPTHTPLLSHSRQHTRIAPASQVQSAAKRAHTPGLPPPRGLSAARTRPLPAHTPRPAARSRGPRAPAPRAPGKCSRHRGCSTAASGLRLPRAGQDGPPRSRAPTPDAPGQPTGLRPETPFSAAAPQGRTPRLGARRRRNSGSWRREGEEPERLGAGRGGACQGACPSAGENLGRKLSARAGWPPSNASAPGGRGPGVRGVAELGGSVRRRAACAFPLASPGDRKRP